MNKDKESFQRFDREFLALRKRLTAPPGKFRLIHVDHMSLPFEEDTYMGDYNDLQSAREARQRYLSRPTSYGEYLIYDDAGRFIE